MHENCSVHSTTKKEPKAGPFTREPKSRFYAGPIRHHFLEWNPEGRPTLVLVHGASANAWWWESVASAIAPRLRLLALDLRGHGDSEWARPPAYRPEHYAADLARFIEATTSAPPIVVGHSMGGIVALACACAYPRRQRAVVAIDLALTSSDERNRYLRRLRALPKVVYPDFETAKRRFRLMPDEGTIDAGLVARIAERSVRPAAGGGFTFKFDRESFFGGDGLDVMEAVRQIQVPLLLVRGEKSRIMTADAATRALRINPRARLEAVAHGHHHLPLEHPAALARIIESFARENAGR